MRKTVVLVGALVVGCGSGNSSSPLDGGAVGDSGGSSDSGVAIDGAAASPFPLPPADAGSSPALTALYGTCAGAAPKPLTAGSWTEPRSGATLHWPAGWSAAAPNAGGGAFAPYTYVPTGASAPTDARVTMTISPSGVSSDAQGQEVLNGWVSYAKAHAGTASQITIGGHPAVVWWDEEVPPQPGCQGCPGDPGPDLVEVGLAAYLGDTPTFGGLTVVEVQGRARVNAQPAEIVCDMEQIALGVTFAK